MMIYREWFRCTFISRNELVTSLVGAPLEQLLDGRARHVSRPHDVQLLQSLQLAHGVNLAVCEAQWREAKVISAD